MYVKAVFYFSLGYPQKSMKCLLCADNNKLTVWNVLLRELPPQCGVRKQQVQKKLDHSHVSQCSLSQKSFKNSEKVLVFGTGDTHRPLWEVVLEVKVGREHVDRSGKASYASC